jgi:hypothetical protein
MMWRSERRRVLSTIVHALRSLGYTVGAGVGVKNGLNADALYIFFSYFSQMYI